MLQELCILLCFYYATEIFLPYLPRDKFYGEKYDGYLFLEKNILKCQHFLISIRRNNIAIDFSFLTLQVSIFLGEFEIQKFLFFG